jgi:hypothetical protein
MDDKQYWVVEFRFPLLIDKAQTPEEASKKACAAFEKENGLNVSGWFTRVFKYSTDAIGPEEEWFFGPSGVKAYRIDKNHIEHEEIIDGKSR